MALLDIFRPKPDVEPEPEEQTSRIPWVPVRQIIDAQRRNDLLKLESYLRGTQHAHKRYDWDGRLSFGDGESLDIPTSGYVPQKRRRPAVGLRMGKLITRRLTTMTFGHDRFPTIAIDGDRDAEDYVRELAKLAKLRTMMVEARDKGGACGSVVLSWGFADGAPIIDVHSSALIEVLEWQDYVHRKPAVVLKVVDWRKRVYYPGKPPEQQDVWRVRYWDDQVERTWDAIPADYAERSDWQSWPSETIEHGLGQCPVIWVQNIQDSDDVDGICDADGQHDDFDQLDCLASSTTKGTIANVDPTLVINDRKGKDETIVRKGTGTVIYSPGGASYLELKGTAIEAAKSLTMQLRQQELDEAEVVVLDPEKLAGAGVSAASLEVRYLSMLAKCDLLRDQYGDAITTVLRDLLEAARRLAPGAVAIPTKIVEIEVDGSDEKQSVEVPRSPGKSSRISLKWPPYFPARWDDRKAGVETAKLATGGQPVLSQRSAVELLASMLDIEDVDAELARINEDRSSQDIRAKELLDAGAPMIETQRSEPDGGTLAT